MPVQLWMLRLERPLTEREYEKLLPMLPPERRARLERQPAEKHGEILCAYGLLTMLLRERYSWQTLPAMEAEPDGKPFFTAYPGVCFSLSHTAGAAAAAVSDTPVGVDIQCLRPVSTLLMERLGAESPEAFFSCWVQLEARTKRDGNSILTQLRNGVPLPGMSDAVYTPFSGYWAGLSAAEPPAVVRCLTAAELLALI